MLFFFFFFLVFFVFYFIKISKFALPGVMLMYERTSKDRKKESFASQSTIFQSYQCVFWVHISLNYLKPGGFNHFELVLAVWPKYLSLG